MENDILQTNTLVVGAGPAGTTCASLLHKAGIDTLLVDVATFPRDKICGGGLTPKAYRLLAELMPDLDYPYHSEHRISLLIEGTKRCSFDMAEELRIVNRKDFDNRLLCRYTDSGGRYLKGCFERFDTQADGTLLVTLRSGQQVSCRHLVGADGANSHVRQQVAGAYDGNVLCLEQYLPKSGEGLVGGLSRRYGRGYYYLFPGTDRDVVGYGAVGSGKSDFLRVMNEMQQANDVIHGAYIPIRTVLSPLPQVMLIGDAGGYANRVTYEGLYYAFATARNAAQAIVEDKPFADTNADILRRKRKEELLVRLVYSRLGLSLIALCARNVRLTKRLFDHYV